MSTLPAGGAHGAADWLEQAHERLAGWSRPGAVATLWAIGGVLDLLFLIAFALRFPIVDHYRGLTDVATLSGKSASGALLWAVSLTVAFALYALGWRRARAAGRAGVAPVLATGLVAALVLLFVYPVTAIDEYVYLVHGRIWAFHGGNPLVQPPNLFPDERLLNMTGEFGNAPAPYGPLWIGASGLVARLAGDDLLVGLLLFKGLAVASYAACAWLISRLLVATGDEGATAGTLLFAWNPVVLIDVAGNGHNDAAMMALVLAAVVAARSRWRVAAPALLCLAALVKYVAGALVPLLLIELWCSRERLGGRLRLVGGAIGLSVVAAVPVLWPFWAGPRTLEALVVRNQLVIGSPLAIALSLAHGVAPSLAANDLKLVFAGALLVFYAGEMWRVWRGQATWLEAGLSSIAAAIAAVPWFNSWFLVWLLALAPLAGRARTRRTLLVFTLTALLAGVALGHRAIWPGGLWPFEPAQALGGALTFLPPLLAISWRRRVAA